MRGLWIPPLVFAALVMMSHRNHGSFDLGLALLFTAFILLHVVLASGPLTRLDRRWSFLLPWRRGLGLSVFALLAGLCWLGDSAWVHSVQFATLLMLPLALTSNEAARRALGPLRWRRLHLLIYPAFVCLFIGVLLAIQLQTHPVPAALVGAGALLLCGVHLFAASRARSRTGQNPSPKAPEGPTAGQEAGRRVLLGVLAAGAGGLFGYGFAPPAPVAEQAPVEAEGIVRSVGGSPFLQFEKHGIQTLVFLHEPESRLPAPGTRARVEGRLRFRDGLSLLEGRAVTIDGPEVPPMPAPPVEPAPHLRGVLVPATRFFGLEPREDAKPTILFAVRDRHGNQQIFLVQGPTPEDLEEGAGHHTPILSLLGRPVEINDATIQHSLNIPVLSFDWHSVRTLGSPLK